MRSEGCVRGRARAGAFKKALLLILLLQGGSQRKREQSETPNQENQEIIPCQASSFQICQRLWGSRGRVGCCGASGQQ
jgi:hypothetical protein